MNYCKKVYSFFMAKYLLHVTFIENNKEVSISLAKNNLFAIESCEVLQLVSCKTLIVSYYLFLR
jgi:hypothetical protein